MLVTETNLDLKALPPLESSSHNLRFLRQGEAPPHIASSIPISQEKSEHPEKISIGMDQDAQERVEFCLFP